MSLYLKYRPQGFSAVVGQSHVKQTIQSALKANNLSHAYLFCGPRGTGKTSMARILAKGLNCLNLNEAEPCDTCEICTAILNGRLVDLIEIDAASNRGIDEIRELREKIVFSPTQARTKVYIIDEVHMLTKEAFNALLKTLEEPPSHAYFVLATTEAHKIPETIISRCQQFGFKRISDDEIVGNLKMIAKKEEVEAEEAALLLIAKISRGGMRDAIGLLEQMISAGQVTEAAVSKHLGLAGMAHLETFLNHLFDVNALAATDLLSELRETGQAMDVFCNQFIAYHRERLLTSLHDKVEAGKLMLYIEAFLKAKTQIDLSPLPELPVEVAIIKSCGYMTPIFEAPTTTPVAHAASKESVKESLVEEGSQESETLAEPQAVPVGNLDLKAIKEGWDSVLNHIKTPFIKLSLKDGRPVKYDSGILTLEFASKSYMEKVNSSNNQSAIQEAIMNVYGCKLSLNCILNASVSNETEAKVKITKASSGPTAVEMAAEVFGIN